MSSTYDVKAGDDFATVSRTVYGTEAEAGRISRANPGVNEPLSAGVILSIPVLPDDPQNAIPTAPSNNLDEVAIRIDGKRFRFWTDVTVSRRIDSFDVVSFEAPFEAALDDFRETFKPFSYKTMDITVGGDLLFTGTMFITPALRTTEKTVRVSGYSLPGVLNDCPLPATTPFEYNGVALGEIAGAVAAPFGIGVQFDDDQGEVFESVAIRVGENVLSFLADLAKQRGLIMSSTPRGKLLFYKSITVGVPVAQMTQGESPLTSVAPRFSHQSYYSEVTGVEHVQTGLNGAKHTVRNPHARGFVRPFSYTVPDTVSGGLKAAVEGKAARMIGAAIGYSLVVATWRTPAGDLWSPNTLLQLTAPDVMVYEPYDFLIKSVEFVKDRAAERAILTLTLPGAFSGSLPEALPWDV